LATARDALCSGGGASGSNHVAGQDVRLLGGDGRDDGTAAAIHLQAYFHVISKSSLSNRVLMNSLAAEIHFIWRISACCWR
jgi:hypothetical protein